MLNIVLPDLADIPVSECAGVVEKAYVENMAKLRPALSKHNISIAAEMPHGSAASISGTFDAIEKLRKFAKEAGVAVNINFSSLSVSGAANKDIGRG